MRILRRVGYRTGSLREPASFMSVSVRQMSGSGRQARVIGWLTNEIEPLIVGSVQLAVATDSAS